MDPCDEDEFDATLLVSSDFNEDAGNSSTVYYESSSDEYDSGSYTIIELL